MKSRFYKFLSHLVIPAFLFYWAVTIALGVSSVTERNRIGKAFPRLNKWFGHSWNLFVEAIDYDDRFYLIIRDKTTKQQTDSFELLQEIAIDKQHHAPFNQNQYVTDRLVNHYVNYVKHLQIVNLEKIEKDPDRFNDPEVKKRLDSMAKKSIAFQNGEQTLLNYCKMVAAKKNIDTTNKEFKIVIVERKMVRFEQRNNEKAVPKNILFFESDYNSFTP